MILDLKALFLQYDINEINVYHNRKLLSCLLAICGDVYKMGWLEFHGSQTIYIIFIYLAVSFFSSSPNEMYL